MGKGKPFNYPLQEAIYDLENEYDTILICAAGNGGADGIGDDIDYNPVYPAAYDGNAILSVAATTSQNELAPFSNYGVTNVDLAAPGTNMIGPTVSRKLWYYEDFSYGSQWTTGRTLYDYSGMGGAFILICLVIAGPPTATITTVIRSIITITATPILLVH